MPSSNARREVRVNIFVGPLSAPLQRTIRKRATYAPESDAALERSC